MIYKTASDIRPEETLKASVQVTVRFCEVDSMNIVWHGSYVKYFEDAREAFGKKYGLSYLDIYGKGFYAPLVDLNFNYKKPLIYGDVARVEITYHHTPAAKLIFTYEVYSEKNNELIATGKSTQVFLDMDYQLIWSNPDFYLEWKEKYKLI